MENDNKFQKNFIFIFPVFIVIHQVPEFIIMLSMSYSQIDICQLIEYTNVILFIFLKRRDSFIFYFKNLKHFQLCVFTYIYLYIYIYIYIIYIYIYIYIYDLYIYHIYMYAWMYTGWVLGNLNAKVGDREGDEVVSKFVVPELNENREFDWNVCWGKYDYLSVCTA